MNPGLHRWQGMTLTSLATPELIEIAQLLDQLHANRTGRRLMTDRAHAACSREHLYLSVRTLDLALEEFRPLGTPRLPGPASSTPTASPSNRSGPASPAAGSPTEPGADLFSSAASSTKPGIRKGR